MHTIDSIQVAPAGRVGSKPARWAGRVLTGLAVLFLTFDGVAKVLMVEPVLEACEQLDIPARLVPGLGVVLMAATLLYAIPSTSPLSAVLLTGYLGGAVWTHLRVGDPIFPIVFPLLLGAIVWGGLYLREPRLRALLPACRAHGPSVPDA